MDEDLNDTADLALVVTHTGSRPLCRVRGEIELATASAVRKVLDSFVEIGELDIDLDLSEVTFIDSHGIAELVLAHQHGLRINITDASPSARRVLDLTQIESVIAQLPR